MNAKQLSRLKVSGTYLSIVMLMSIIFSFAIYQISDRELSQQRRVEIPHGIRGFISLNEFDILRQQQLEQSRDNLRQKLITFNLLTLAGGAFLSYFLALRSLKPIEDALEKQDRFTSDASHEIRTPLTVMRSEIEVALRDKKFNLTDAKNTLNSNLEEITRLEALTSGLLQLAKQENNPNLKQTLKAGQVIKQAIEKTGALADAKNLKIKFVEAKDTEVYAEPGSLLQLMVILLDNAIKYSPKKGEVTVTTKNLRASTEIRVKDNGPGINPKDLPHIFDRFYRSDSARSKSAEQNGYGLGLAIAKQIVASHSGEINIKNLPKSGTQATIVLPKK